MSSLILAFCCQPAILLAEHHEEIPRVAPRQAANSIIAMSRDFLSNNPSQNADRKAFFGDLPIMRSLRGPNPDSKSKIAKGFSSRGKGWAAETELMPNPVWDGWPVQLQQVEES